MFGVVRYSFSTNILSLRDYITNSPALREERSFKFEVVGLQTSNLKPETSNLLVPPLGVRGLFLG